MRWELSEAGTLLTFELDWQLKSPVGRVRRRILEYMLTSRVMVRASAIAQVLSNSADPTT